MKLVKSTFILFLLTLITSQSYAQFSLGAHAGHLTFIDPGLSAIGLGLRGEYPIHERLSIGGQVNFYKGENYSYESNLTILNAGDAATVGVTEKFNTIHLSIEGKGYAFGGYDSEFGVYGFAGGGLMLVPYSFEVDSYDANEYALNGDFSNETFQGFTITLGVGAEKTFDFGAIFVEGRMNLVANEQNGVAIEPEIPNSRSVNAGVRINIGE